MTEVVLYTRPGCHLCEHAAAALQALEAEFPHALLTVDIDTDPALRKKYTDLVPVLLIARRYRLLTQIEPAHLREVFERLAAEG
ncbi:MAG: glutaredoxin family protein [Fimbriimonadaceae bacterium]|nr:glutaredoxin family protein [Fimbriimonadaceae bacterium]